MTYLCSFSCIVSSSFFIIYFPALIRLFDKHAKDGRVILPLLVSIDKLLSHGLLDTVLSNTSSDFSSQLSLRVRREASKCTDVKRLIAIVPVALSILDSNNSDIQSTILLFLMRLLSHRFPSVRRNVAEQMYIKLIEDDSVLPNAVDVEEATNLLSQTRWDRELGPPGNIREIRNQVADLLGVALSEKDRTGPALKKVVKVTDEFASYASLVSSAGR